MRRFLTYAAGICTLLWLVSSATASSQQRDKWVIEGQVVDAQTGAPLSKADVLLRKRSENTEELHFKTGPDGRFRFEGQETAACELTVQRTGYLRQQYRESRRGPALLAVGRGMERTGILVALLRSAAITGKVTDESGDPVEYMTVVAIRQGQSGPRRTQRGPTGITNDLGEFRIPGLAKGKYLVRSDPSGMGSSWTSMEYSQQGRPVIMQRNDGRMAEYEPTFSPGTLSPNEAAIVELNTGEEARADIWLQPSHAVAVRGRIPAVATLKEGRTLSNWNVRLIPAESERLFIDELMVNYIKGTGEFEFRSVRPGQYTLFVLFGEEGDVMFSSVPVEVGRQDVEGIEVYPTPGIELKGRITVEGGVVDFEDVSVFLVASEGPRRGSIDAEIDEKGNLAFDDLIAGKYQVHFRESGGDYYLKSARWGGGCVGRQPELAAGQPTTVGTGYRTIEFICDWHGSLGGRAGGGKCVRGRGRCRAWRSVPLDEYYVYWQRREFFLRAVGAGGVPGICFRQRD